MIITYSGIYFIYICFFSSVCWNSSIWHFFFCLSGWKFALSEVVISYQHQQQQRRYHHRDYRGATQRILNWIDGYSLGLLKGFSPIRGHWVVEWLGWLGGAVAALFAPTDLKNPTSFGAEICQPTVLDIHRHSE